MSKASKPKHDDPSSSYYLSGQGILGNSLTKDPFKGNNHATWEQAAIMALKSYNKLGFVDGSISKLANTSDDYYTGEIINSIIYSWILNSLNPSIRTIVSRMFKTQTMWEVLKTRYTIRDGPRTH